MSLSNTGTQLVPLRNIKIEGEEYVVAALRVTVEEFEQVKQLLNTPDIRIVSSVPKNTKPKDLFINVSEQIASATRLR